MAIKKTRSGKKVNVYTKRWSTVKDSNIRHVWAPPGTDREITISPDWYADNGTPVCDCDDIDEEGNSLDGIDMIYIRTEVCV